MHKSFEIWRQNNSLVNQEMKKLDRVINALNNLQQQDLDELNCQAPWKYSDNEANDSVELQTRRKNYTAMQQHLEMLLMMRRYLQVLNWNPFYSVENMLSLLAPMPVDSTERMILTSNNFEAYIYQLRDNIIAIPDEKRIEFYSLFATILTVGILCGVGAALGCTFGLPTAALMVLGAVCGSGIAIGFIHGGAGYEERRELDEAKKYLQMATKDTAIQLNADDHFFSSNLNFNWQTRNMVCIEAQDDAVYCYVRSDLTDIGRQFTVKLSPDLSKCIKSVLDSKPADGNALNDQLKMFKTQIFDEINKRQYTTLLRHEHSSSSTWMSASKKLRQADWDRCKPRIKLLSGSQSELRIRFFSETLDDDHKALHDNGKTLAEEIAIAAGLPTANI